MFNLNRMILPMVKVFYIIEDQTKFIQLQYHKIYVFLVWPKMVLGFVLYSMCRIKSLKIEPFKISSRTILQGEKKKNAFRRNVPLSILQKRLVIMAQTLKPNTYFLFVTTVKCENGWDLHLQTSSFNRITIGIICVHGLILGHYI